MARLERKEGDLMGKRLSDMTALVARDHGSITASLSRGTILTQG